MITWWFPIHEWGEHLRHKRDLPWICYLQRMWPHVAPCGPIWPQMSQAMLIIIDNSIMINANGPTWVCHAVSYQTKEEKGIGWAHIRCLEFCHLPEHYRFHIIFSKQQKQSKLQTLFFSCTNTSFSQVLQQKIQWYGHWKLWCRPSSNRAMVQDSSMQLQKWKRFLPLGTTYFWQRLEPVHGYILEPRSQPFPLTTWIQECSCKFMCRACRESTMIQGQSDTSTDDCHIASMLLTYPTNI